MAWFISFENESTLENGDALEVAELLMAGTKTEVDVI